MTIKDKVTQLLTENPNQRDDVANLMHTYLIKEFGLDHNTAAKIVTYQSHLENVNRQWRLVQRQTPELRGEHWIDRQNLSKEVKEHYKKTGEILTKQGLKALENTPKIATRIESIEEFIGAYKYLSQQINKLGYIKEECEIVMGDFSYKLPIFNEVSLNLMNEEYVAFEQAYLDHTFQCSHYTKSF